MMLFHSLLRGKLAKPWDPSDVKEIKLEGVMEVAHGICNDPATSHVFKELYDKFNKPEGKSGETWDATFTAYGSYLFTCSKMIVKLKRLPLSFPEEHKNNIERIKEQFFEIHSLLNRLFKTVSSFLESREVAQNYTLLFAIKFLYIDILNFQDALRDYLTICMRDHTKSNVWNFTDVLEMIDGYRQQVD